MLRAKEILDGISAFDGSTPARSLRSRVRTLKEEAAGKPVRRAVSSGVVERHTHDGRPGLRRSTASHPLLGIVPPEATRGRTERDRAGGEIERVAPYIAGWCTASGGGYEVYKVFPALSAPPSEDVLVHAPHGRIGSVLVFWGCWTVEALVSFGPV